MTNKRGKIGGIGLMLLLSLAGLLIGFLWNHISIIKDSVHLILDPTLGVILDQDVNLGMVLITALITFIISITQKYTMDHEKMKELKANQKDLQNRMKEYKDHPEKLAEINKEFFGTFSELMTASMSSAVYTIIPIILFFRWFQDYFALHEGVKIFGFLSWFWAYLIVAIIFSSVFRKLLKLP